MLFINAEIYILKLRKAKAYLFILHIQYHCCWWPGDTRSQGISNDSIDLVILEYISFNIKGGYTCKFSNDYIGAGQYQIKSFEEQFNILLSL